MLGQGVYGRLQGQENDQQAGEKGNLVPDVDRMARFVPFAQAIDVQVSGSKQEQGRQGISCVPGQPQVIAGVNTAVSEGDGNVNQQLPRSHSAHPNQHPPFEVGRVGPTVLSLGTGSLISVFSPKTEKLEEVSEERCRARLH